MSAMELLARERDRLLHRTARLYGLCFTVISLACLTVPGAVSAEHFALSVPLYLALGLSQFRLGSSRALGWVIATLVSGLLLVVVITLGDPSEAGVLATTQLAAGALPATGIVCMNHRIRRIVFGIASVLAVVLTTVLLAPVRAPLPTLALVLLGWVLAGVVGYWIGAAVPRVARRIGSIGHAHRAERQASELEAQRRQGARLLHDTVLATLTLLAHSGVGVQPDSLRKQAAEDAQLLRQLRLGTVPANANEPGAATGDDLDAELGTTLESVKQRFNRMGLNVSWHGTGQVLLAPEVLDAFLLALAECLENVRRHSGVTEAHVTISGTETTVRAMVTDAGVGFAIDDVDSARLGLKESVIGRLDEVGGSARLFSSPGQGTTVLLEVPR